MSKNKRFTLTDFSNAARIENFRLDEDGKLVKREGCRMLYNFYAEIRGTLSDNEKTYVVAGTGFWVLENEQSSYVGDLYDASFYAGEKVTMLMRGETVYIIGGGTYFTYSRLTGQLSKVSGYVPIVKKVVSDSDDTSESETEEINILTSTVRVSIKPSTGRKSYLLWGMMNQIDSITADGELIPSYAYDIERYTGVCNLVFNSYDYLYASEIIVEYQTDSDYSSEYRERYLHNIRTYVYQGKDTVRIFLYGGSLGADIMYSELSTDDSGKLVSGLDYFPEYARFTVGDGTKPVTDIVNFDGKTVISTNAALHEPVEITVKNPAGNSMQGFTTKLLYADLGAIRNTDSKVFDGIMYILSERGLFRFFYDYESQSYITSEMEFASYARLDSSSFGNAGLYISTVRSELWCYIQNEAYVFDLKRGTRYRFGGFPVDKMLTHNGSIGFVSGSEFYIYDSNMQTDENIGIKAVYESRPIDLGNVFTSKDIYSFGVLFDRVSLSRLDCSLTSDKGVQYSLSVSPDNAGAPSPAVKWVHARMGNVNHITCRIESPADAAGTNVRAIAFEFSEKGDI